ncbi:MAG: PilZ domain-containing protein [Bdellovibrionales bacterium]|jgi:hypothetical protein|nr:PilZ domain-containing protein [Bdellovibrionales bacterium]
MWNLFSSKKNPAAKKSANKRTRNRRPTAQKAVLVSQESIIFRILDMSSRGARLKGPALSSLPVPPGADNILEFLIHYGGAQYKRVRGLIRWSEPKNKTFGIEFVD